MYRIVSPLAGMLAGLGIATAIPAAAEPVCVRCDSPFALYACDIVHPDVTAETPVGFLCIRELAKRYGHQTCGVSRGTGGRCAGEAVVLALPPDEPLPASVPPALSAPPLDDGALADSNTGDKPPAEQAVSEAAPDEKGPPKTVKDLAESTAEVSKEGLKTAQKGVVDVAKKTGEVIGDTGEVIGDAAKKTWRCLSSLFGDC